MKHGHPVRGLLAAAFVGWAAGSMPAAAVSLEEAYLAAREYDADLLAAKSAQEEVQEGVPVARAALLPQLSYSVQKNTANTYTDYVNPRFKDNDSGNYDSNASVLTFRQALFRKPAWDALQVANAQAGAADAVYLKEIQNLALRVVASYLDVLWRRTNATLTQKHTQAMQAWLDLAERAFKAGRGTLTDIADARSRRDISLARQTEATIGLAEAARNFEVFTGLKADKIPDLNPRLLDPNLILLEHKEQWLQRIEESSPDIQSLRMQLEAAQSTVAQMRGGHLPTVDLVASYRNSLNDTDTSLTNPAEYTTKYVGIQVTVPLLSGGGVVAQTSQALAREEKIRQLLESARRKTLAEADRLFLTIQQGRELVMALTQAVVSAEQAVLGEKKGIQAGTRTLVDALDSERRMYESMSEQAKSIYMLANNRFKFLALAGAIDPESVRITSAWLDSARQ